MRITFACAIIYVYSITPSFKALCESRIYSEIEKKGREIFMDRKFEHGFSLTPLDPKVVYQGGGFEKTNVDTLFWEKEKQIPVWQLSQWYSKYTLAHVKPELASDGSITFRNEGKRIVRYPDGSVLLELNTDKEYSHPRKQGEPWPHILIEQKFGNQSPIIGQAKELLFSMELKLVKCKNRMTEGTFDETLHTAQSPFYFVLENKRTKSNKNQKFIWFGIPSFDYRYQQTSSKEKISWDIGTGTYIYNLPETAAWGNVSFQDGNWHKAMVDILPFVKTALEAMKSKGVFTTINLNDFRITGMNFGWEIPGTFDAAVLVRNFSLRVTK